MTPDEFINSVRQVVFESAINGTLSVMRKPPGRSPAENLLTLSKWFDDLSEYDKEMLQRAIAIAAHQATFGMLAVLDGARQIEDSPAKGTLELHYVKGDQHTALNAPDAEALHDLLNQHGMPY
jgi:hypothetical protein